MNYKNLSRLTLLVVLLISIGLSIGLNKISFDYNFESFFPLDDPERAFFYEYRENFGSDNDFITIGLENNEGIFRPSFLHKLTALKNALDTLNYVKRVITPMDLKQTIVDPFGMVSSVNWVKGDDLASLKRDSTLIYEEELLVDMFFSKKAPVVSVMLFHDDFLSKKKSDQLMKNISSVIQQFDFDDVWYAGRIHGQMHYMDKMRHELLVFICVSVLLVIVFLYYSFKSLWSIVIPLIVVGLCVLWVFAIMSWTGKQIDIISLLLPTILFVVGMSDVVHIISKYLEELRNRMTKFDAVWKTFREIGLATFLTSLTTSIGFFTLRTSSIQPIKDFGTYTSIGVFIAFLLAFSVLPSLLLLMNRPEIVKKRDGKIFWIRQLRALFLWTLRNRNKILVFSGFLVAASMIGIFNIKIDNKLLEDIADDDPVKRGYIKCEEYFSGSRPFEMALILKDTTKSFYDLAVLREVDKVAHYLASEHGIKSILSISGQMSHVHRAIKGGGKAQMKLPENKQDLKRCSKLLKRASQKGVIPDLISLDGGKMTRISGLSADFGGNASKKKNSALKHFFENNIDTKLLSYHITGTAHLIDRNNENLVWHLLKGILFAFLVVALIVGLGYWSLRMIIISLITNILPLVVIAGIMGFANIHLKISTSIIFTIAFGIAVDDTIHFISKLKLELNKGKSLIYAVKRTYLSAGKAIVVTSVILSGGFVSLIISDFTSIADIGVLVSLTLVIALVCDLMLLPILLIKFFPYRKVM